jgi:hypothetical protein
MHQEHSMNPRQYANHTTSLHRLRHNQFLSLRRSQGLCVRAERGTLWVTVDGELADVVLSPGDSRVFNGPEAVVVGAVVGDAVFSTTATTAPSWFSRLQIWLHSPAMRVRT